MTNGRDAGGGAVAARYFGDPAVAERVAAGLDGGQPHGGALVVARMHRGPLVTHDAVVDAVGTRFCVRAAHDLIGMVRGERRHIGGLRLGPHDPVRWGYWFPHLGIAVDTDVHGPAEVAARAAWAEGQGILYFSPRVNAPDQRLDLIGLATVAAQRRAACGGA